MNDWTKILQLVYCFEQCNALHNLNEINLTGELESNRFIVVDRKFELKF